MSFPLSDYHHLAKCWPHEEAAQSLIWSCLVLESRQWGCRECDDRQTQLRRIMMMLVIWLPEEISSQFASCWSSNNENWYNNRMTNSSFSTKPNFFTYPKIQVGSTRKEPSFAAPLPACLSIYILRYSMRLFVWLMNRNWDESIERFR